MIRVVFIAGAVFAVVLSNLGFASAAVPGCDSNGTMMVEVKKGEAPIEVKTRKYCHDWAQNIAKDDASKLESDFRMWSWIALILLVLIAFVVGIVIFFFMPWYKWITVSVFLRYFIPMLLATGVSFVVGWGLLNGDLPAQINKAIGPDGARVKNMSSFYERCQQCDEDGTQATRGLVSKLAETADEGQKVSSNSIAKSLRNSSPLYAFSWPWVQAGATALLGVFLAFILRFLWGRRRR